MANTVFRGSGPAALCAALWIGLSAPLQAQISKADVTALVEALRLAAPKADKRPSGLYSDWQIKAGNISRWSKRCTGESLTPTEFEMSPATARAILSCVMGDVLREQYPAAGNDEAVAVRRAAAWWLTGQPERYDDGAIASYTERVLGHYRQPGGEPTAAAPAPSAAGSLLSSLRPAAKPKAAVSPAQVAALGEALRLAAPRTGRADDGLYSDWQIKPGNVQRWSQRCLGRPVAPESLETDREAAREIVECVMQGVLGEQLAAAGDEWTAVRRAAAWWMTGDPQRFDDEGVRAYTREVLDFYVIRRKIDAG